MSETINLNDTVKVKVTELGEQELTRQHWELKRRFPKLPPFKLNRDSDGYTEFQLWSLMGRLGHMMGGGLPLVVEAEIKLSKDTTTSPKPIN